MSENETVGIGALKVEVDDVKSDVHDIKKSLERWGWWALGLATGAVSGLLIIASISGVALYRVEVNEREHLRLETRVDGHDDDLANQRSASALISYQFETINEKLTKIEKSLEKSP